MLVPRDRGSIALGGLLAVAGACGAPAAASSTTDAAPRHGAELGVAAELGEDAELGVGAELDARDELGGAVRLRIDAIEVDPRGGDELPLYTVSARDGGGWRAYCPSGAATVVVPGAWDSRGGYVEDPTLTTFACTDGAIAKCVRMGYAPWRRVGGVTLLEHHLACVRMIRADYCGDGVSHTRDGTRVVVWDDLGLVAREPSAGALEAAWSRDGAVYLARPRRGGDVAEVLRGCPERLAGRTSLDVVLDATEIDARFPEAVIFAARRPGE